MIRLLQELEFGELRFREFEDTDAPAFAILSHTWAIAEEGKEVTYRDIQKNETHKILPDNSNNLKKSLAKIHFCAVQAKKDGLEWFWVDTCCIDKENKAELGYAIKSMYRWYRRAAKCYVYLSDVGVESEMQGVADLISDWIPVIRQSRWFTRGWTLQELLAPTVVEFFSAKGILLGNKIILSKQICAITGVPERAIEGAKLSDWSIDERLHWIQDRETHYAEDKVYSLLGLLEVYIPPFYGEGLPAAFQRLREEIDKQVRCIQDLRLSDPRDDRKRIIATKGGLLDASYTWILDHTSFTHWQENVQSRLLWLKGDPGKGKTMLLCGITSELGRSKNHNLAYFFCQGTDSNINNATAVLRGLIYMLVSHQPTLTMYLRQRYDNVGRALFEGANAWYPLSEAFTSMIQDELLRSTYLMVDALDECIADLPKLLDLIIETSMTTNRVKWLVSSRNEFHIEQKFRSINTEARLSLELKQNAERVAHAVEVYIDEKLCSIESVEDPGLRRQIRTILREKANGTFLWVALVVQELENPECWDPLGVVEEAPTGLYELYERMLGKIERLAKANLSVCRSFLSTILAAYRPLFVAELGALGTSSATISAQNTEKIVAMCGSFLTIRRGRVYLIHQSAKDYLSDGPGAAFLVARDEVHFAIFLRSLNLMSVTLKRDIYGITNLRSKIDDIEEPKHRPLAELKYSCSNWTEHLSDSNIGDHTERQEALKDNGIIHNFLKTDFLYWLEALSLCKNLKAGHAALMRLTTILKESGHGAALKQLVDYSKLHVLLHMSTIENVPQQTYGAALLFSATPATSFMQTLFKHEIPRHISLRLLNEMSSEQHSGAVTSIAFTQDSTYLASASDDGTIRIWNSLNGLCRIVLEGHRYSVEALAFSQDSRFLISGSFDCSVKFWDTSSGVCLLNLEAHNSPIAAVSCSHDSLTVASGSSDGAVKHWSTSDDGVLLRTIQASYGPISSLGFSPNKSDHLMTVSIDSVIKVWNTNSGACLQIIDVGESLYDVAFDVPPLYLQTTVHEVSIGSSKLAGSQIPNQVYEVTGPQHMPLSRGYDRRVNDKWDYEWITSESGEILWIPPDFRPSCVRRNGNMIAFGLATGKVWLCLLDPLDLDSTHAETSWQENI